MATPQRAFEVFTREISAWWQASSLFRFTPRSPGVVSFEPGVGGRFMETFADGEIFEIGRLTVWEPGRRLAFSWRQASFNAGELTHVEVSFEPLGLQTRVTVEHHGWDSVPQQHVALHGAADAIFLQRHAEWWQAQLAALRTQSAAA